MKYLLVVFVVLNFGIDSLVIKRRDEVQPANSNDQGITNSTGNSSSIINSNQTFIAEDQQNASKRVKVPFEEKIKDLVLKYKSQTKDQEQRNVKNSDNKQNSKKQSKGQQKSGQKNLGQQNAGKKDEGQPSLEQQKAEKQQKFDPQNIEHLDVGEHVDKLTSKKPDSMQSALLPEGSNESDNPSKTNDDITKASQEVAEISRLIGKPLTDSHALSMLKNILLEKIHTKLEETKDTATASSKTTEEGVSKFVAALAASKTKASDREKDKLLESHTDDAQKSDLTKQLESKEPPFRKNNDSHLRCKYLQKLGLCDSNNRSEVRERCQLACGACADCPGYIVDCGTVCIGSDVAASPPPPTPPTPAPTPPPIPPPAPPPEPLPPHEPLHDAAPPPPPPAPVQLVPAHAEATEVEPAHLPGVHAHDAQGHAIVTTPSPHPVTHPTTAIAQHVAMTSHELHPTLHPQAAPTVCPPTESVGTSQACKPEAASCPPPCSPEAPASPPPLKPEIAPCSAPCKPETAPTLPPCKPDVTPCSPTPKPETAPCSPPCKPEAAPCPPPCKLEAAPCPSPCKPEAAPCPPPCKPEAAPCPTPCKPEAAPCPPTCKPEAAPCTPPCKPETSSCPHPCQPEATPQHPPPKPVAEVCPPPCKPELPPCPPSCKPVAENCTSTTCPLQQADATHMVELNANLNHPATPPPSKVITDLIHNHPTDQPKLGEDSLHHHLHSNTPTPPMTTLAPLSATSVPPGHTLSQPVAPLVINPVQNAHPTQPTNAAAGVCCAPDGVKKCENPVDIGLLLDSSAAVKGRWGYIKKFAELFIDHFKMGEFARFGVIQFDTIAKFPIRLETYNDAEMLKLHVRKLMMNPFGKRRTDDALKLARSDLFATARNGVRKAMLIITNGRTNGDDPTINWSQMIVEPSREIQEGGIEVFAIGVTPHAAGEELRVMATDPDTQHVFRVPTFDQLQTVAEPIASRICHGWSNMLSSGSGGIHLTSGGFVAHPTAGPLYRPTGPYGCPVKYAKIGCYSDDGNNPRPLPEELFTDQSPTSPVFTGRRVDFDNWDKYLPDVVCRCAKEADKRGYHLFGLQLFGSCWSGAQAGLTYATDGEADQEMCITLGYKKCEATDKVCVGKQETNFVYAMDDESKRSNIATRRQD